MGTDPENAALSYGDRPLKSNNNYKLPAELALWTISSNLTLAVTEISFSLDSFPTNSFPGSVSGNLLIRR